jgi:hypothetical protein
MSNLCEFYVAAVDAEAETMVCVNCGRTVRLKNAGGKTIYAKCRGDAETRWSRNPAKVIKCRPGTALKSLLATIGITAAPNCSCQRHANEMDARGCDWCEENLDTIVGWLREEATKRGLPFIDAAGRLLVRRAIRNARRAAAN